MRFEFLAFWVEVLSCELRLDELRAMSFKLRDSGIPALNVSWQLRLSFFELLRLLSSPPVKDLSFPL